MPPSGGSRDVVGIDVTAAAELIRLLEQADVRLNASAARIDRILTEAGLTTTIPSDIRSVGRTCGEQANDVRRRASNVGSSVPLHSGRGIVVAGYGRRFWLMFRTGQGRAHCPSSRLPEDRLRREKHPGNRRPTGFVGRRSSTAPQVMIERPTSPAFWVMFRSPGRSGTTRMTTIGERPCMTVYVTPANGGSPGQPVSPPRVLPGFPNAKPSRPKTPVRGGGGLRRRWADPDGNIYEWDRQHGTVEVYDRKGRHRGEFDPDTGAQKKPAASDRKVEP